MGSDAKKVTEKVNLTALSFVRVGEPSKSNLCLLKIIIALSRARNIINLRYGKLCFQRLYKLS